MASPVSKAPDRLTLVAFVLIVIVLGMNFVAVRYSNRELPPFWAASSRFLIASILLAAFARVRGIPMPRNKALVGASLFGVFAIFGVYACLYWALQYVPAGMSSVLMATTPLWTLVIAVSIGQEKFRIPVLLATFGVIAGISIAFYDQVSADVRITALVVNLVAAVCAATSGVVVRGFPRSHPIAANTVAMGVGAILLFAGSLVAQETPALPQETATISAVTYLVASSIVGFGLML